MMLRYMSPIASLLDSWLRQSPRHQLVGELHDLESEFADKLTEFEQLRDHLRALTVEVERRKQAIRFIDELMPGPAVIAGDGEGAEPPEPEATPSRGPGTKPAMVEQILKETLKAMFPREVRDAAVDRGWIENSPAASNQVSVAMNKMAKRGRLKRLDDGRYELPEAAREPELALLTGEGRDE